MIKKHDDDALALKKAIEQGLKQCQLARIEFIVDVFDRGDEATIVSRLRESGYECNVWDDPVDKSLTISAARIMYPTLEAILHERNEVRRVLVDLSVAVEDWGTAIPR